jgi:prepilin-type N-terminal cleavage/methylation domain-containing protein
MTHVLRSKRGFTLIELLLTIVMITLMASVMIPVFIRFQYRDDIDVAASSLVTSFRRAQALAASGELDSAWGVSVQSGKIYLYKGASYAARDTTYDETYDISTAISATGVTEINYAQTTGVPSTSGTTTLTGVNSEQEVITTNAKGIVNY